MDHRWAEPPFLPTCHKALGSGLEKQRHGHRLELCHRSRRRARGSPPAGRHVRYVAAEESVRSGSRRGCGAHYLTNRDMSRIAPGQAAYLLVRMKAGTIADTVIVSSIGGDDWMIVHNSGDTLRVADRPRRRMRRWKSAHAKQLSCWSARPCDSVLQTETRPAHSCNRPADGVASRKLTGGNNCKARKLHRNIYQRRVRRLCKKRPPSWAAQSEERPRFLIPDSALREWVSIGKFL